MVSIPLLLYLVGFLLGLAVGSFLNSVIHRLHTGESLLGGKGEFARSRCPNCRHQLSWQDLIPVLSFILLRGRCMYCRKPISWQYPCVEAATGVLFTALLWIAYPHFVPLFLAGHWQLGLIRLGWLFYHWILASLMVIIFVYDLKHYIIPDKIIFPAIGAALIYRIYEFFSAQWRLQFDLWNFGNGSLNILTNPLLMAIVSASFFGAIVLFSKGKWMGGGDVKLAFLMGLALGWPGIVVAMFLAFLSGALAGVALVVLKKKSMKSEVPFAPFLIAGTVMGLLWSQQIIDWYWELFM